MREGKGSDRGRGRRLTYARPGRGWSDFARCDKAGALVGRVATGDIRGETGNSRRSSGHLAEMKDELPFALGFRPRSDVVRAKLGERFFLLNVGEPYLTAGKR